MGSGRENEMERIRRGLEAFLEQEIGGAGAPEEPQEREPGSPEGPRRDIRAGQRWEEPENPEEPWENPQDRARRDTRMGEWQEERENQGDSYEDPQDRARHDTRRAEVQEESWGYTHNRPWPEQPEESGARRREERKEEWPEETEYTEWEQEERMAEGRKSRMAGAQPQGESRRAGRASSGRQSRSADRTSSGRQSRSADRTSSHAASRSDFPETDWDAVQDRPRRKTSGGSAGPGRGKTSERKGPQGTKGTAEAGHGSGGGRPRREKRRRKKSGLRRFLTAAALILVLLGAGLYWLVGAVYGKMNFKEIASVSKLPMQEEGVVNILLIGNDSRENSDDGRSDAMILLSVSSKTKTIYMTSLLRDMYVEIDGHDSNRLNAAYSFGGAELLMDTVEKNFRIPVNRYVLVNFEAFAGLVDAVGGVELELSSEEIEYVNGYLVEYNMLTGRPQGTDDMDPSASGLVHLNGPQALAYSRNRYLGTDFGRTERQRKVLTAVIKKLPAALLTNAGGLLDGLLPNLTTNLTQNECFRLSLMAGKLLTYEIVSDSIPQPGTYKDATIRKMQVLEVDFETNIRYLREKLYGE